MLLSELAQLVNGEAVGNAGIKVSGVSTIEEAKNGDLVFVLEEKNLADALNSKASAFVLGKNLSSQGKPAILVSNPRLAMSIILAEFSKKTAPAPGIDNFASIHKTAKIGKNVSIGAFVSVGPNASIGDNSIIHPNVSIYEDVVIGKRCIIHSGASIGVDGYGFVPGSNGLDKIPQIGGVVIGDDVEIYSNGTIARGTIGNTVIGSGTKIDCLTHIAHNCMIGKNCAITGLVGFAGSVKFEDNVQVGGQAGFSGHLTVGANSVVMARAGVTKDVPPNSVVSGFPAVEHKKDLELQAAIRRLSKQK